MGKLRVVLPEEVPAARAEPRFAFTFRRRRNGCAVGLKDREGRSWSGLGIQGPNIAAAREWARAYAVKNCFPYAETRFDDPAPSPDEIRKSRASSAAYGANSAMKRAREYEARDEYRRAAEAWSNSAREIEEYADLHPGEEDRWGREAAARVDLAIKALGRYRARLLAKQRGSALRDLPAPDGREKKEE